MADLPSESLDDAGVGETATRVAYLAYRSYDATQHSEGEFALDVWAKPPPGDLTTAALAMK
jgi:hypothetical protein